MKKIIALLFLGFFMMVSCTKKLSTDGEINGDFQLFKDDFDAVVINMRGYEILGDSIITSDTVKAINGKFTYNFSIPELKLVDFVLLKNKTSVGKLGLLNKNYKKGSKTISKTFANFFIGNEKIILECDTLEKIEFNGTINYTVKGLQTVEHDIESKLNITNVSKEIIQENPNSFAVLHQLFWQKERFSNTKLKALMELFSDDLKKSTSYKILKKYLDDKVSLETDGYSKNFNWVDINAKRHTFKEALDGKKYLLLVFWASWCEPCRAEIPNLKLFNSKYSEKLNVVSLSIDDNYEYWKKAVEKENMPWLNLSGLPKDKTAIKKEYNISAVPNLILLDNKGKPILNTINDLEKIKKYIDSH
ncbi:thioredoxin family protein [Flavobacterium sp.]|uniref:TlpA family protein disulfide reductase n=1 Tax=Flavobacterium sp. TaxID=239 RepID=UPI0025B9E5E1|nr:thioredoxin family protein [Flavobacterium sp.]